MKPETRISEGTDVGAVFSVRFTATEVGQLQSRADFLEKSITEYLYDVAMKSLEIPAWRWPAGKQA